jgi:hypothetical protein
VSEGFPAKSFSIMLVGVKIARAHAKFSESGVRHYIDRRSTVDKHLGQWLAIDISLQV